MLLVELLRDSGGGGRDSRRRRRRRRRRSIPSHDVPVLLERVTNEGVTETRSALYEHFSQQCFLCASSSSSGASSSLAVQSERESPYDSFHDGRARHVQLRRPLLCHAA